VRSRVVLRNTLAAVLLQVVIAVFGFITPALVIRSYGSEVNGLVSSISQVLRYFALMEGGLSGAALFALYRPLASDDFEAVNRILGFASRFFKRVGLLYLAVVVVAAPLYALVLGPTTLSVDFIVVIFLVIGLSGALEFLVVARYRLVLTADEKGHLLSLVGGVGVIVQQTTAIVLILANSPVEIVYLTSVPVLLVRGLALRFMVIRVFSRRVSFKSHEERGVSGIHFQRHVFLHEVSYTLNQASPLVAVGVLHGLTVASIYAVYSMPIAMVTLLLATFHQSMTPSFGRLVAEGGAARSNAPFLSFQFLYLLLSTWLLCCTIVLVTPFVYVYTAGIQDTNYVRPEFGYALTLLAAANALRVVYAVLVSAYGLFESTAGWAVATSILGLSLSYLLGDWSAPLVAVGPVAALVLNCLVQLVILRRRVPEVSSSRGMSTALLMFALIGAAGLAGHALELRPDSWASLLWMCVLTATAMLVPIGVVFVVFERRRGRAHVDYLTGAFRRRGMDG